MSDILQAARWMREGRTVTSGQRQRGIYVQEETGRFFTDDGGVRTNLDIDDLLDTTWEPKP